MSSSPAPRPSYRSVFAVAEFRALWLSYVLSAGGDRLALVAMTLLVYARSKSPLLAAITFASGFVPYLFGGFFLSGLADRLPRRTVMVACDVARALLVGLMLAPRLSLGALIALLYMVTLIQPPFDAARSAIVRDIMDADRYPLAAAVLQSTTRVVTVGGAAAGGLVVALFGARPALAADALTFVASALLILFGTRARPAAASAGASGGENPLAQIVGGARLVFGDPALRTLMCLGWLSAFSEVPEGLAAPYVAKLGGGAVAAGLLIAFSQLGVGGDDADLHQEDRSAHPPEVDGPDGGAHLRCADSGYRPPGPGALDGALRPVQRVHDVSDRREHRVRRADTERASRSGLRPRQRRDRGGTGGGFRSSWSGRRGGTSLDGRSSQWGTRCPYRLWSSAPVAANVACRRASHCETSWPRGLAYQADTCPCGSF